MDNFEIVNNIKNLEQNLKTIKNDINIIKNYSKFNKWNSDVKKILKYLNDNRYNIIAHTYNKFNYKNGIV
ncbi:unknown similar to AMEV082 [Mythimna separata entomopoxvirus 'L']|uniref:Uncharacterized protein n=1 Tax=Mythimna separata entomopoxvirus 'L' TaxID=1293572 RepID=A0A916NYC5_9POXV|nr:unknown similar to AMEV082 [Mythimna separata entomopoxvirus 'L']CCU56303.1 unknown similar to AMEV082 [Mythimna separata entomopoxvirus 'L']